MTNLFAGGNLIKNILYYFLPILLVGSSHSCAMENSSAIKKESKTERGEELVLAPLLPVLKKIKDTADAEKDHLECFFREINSWIPSIINHSGEAKTNEDFENLVRYVREYISYSRLDSLSLDKIIECFKDRKVDIEKALEVWSSMSNVRWPGQTHYQAFMGHLFFPVQYELNYEIIRGEVLENLVCKSASFGNTLAMYYAIELLQVYSLEEDSDVIEKPDVKKTLENIFSCIKTDECPVYHTALLCMRLGKFKEAEKFFKKGFEEQNNPWCGYQYALGTRNPDVKKSIIKRLREVHPILADLAEESSCTDPDRRIELHITCGKAGIARSFFIAGLLLEDKDIEKAKNMYQLAAQNHILSAYEKLSELYKKSPEHIPFLKKIYEKWGLAGDPEGFVRLGELLLNEDRAKAISYFGRAGLRGIEKRIEHAETLEERENLKILYKGSIENMYMFVLSQINTGSRALI